MGSRHHGEPALIRRWLFELMYWFRRTPWDTGITPPEVVEWVDQHPPGRAIDLGCGTGTNALYLAHHGWQVVGVDFSTRAIKSAHRKAGETTLSVEFKQADVARLEGIEGPFDLALDIGCFHSLPVEKRAGYADRLSQLVRPEGAYLLYAWLPPKDNPDDSKPSQAEIERLFGAHFKIVNVDLGTEGDRQSAWYTLIKNT